MATGSLDSNGIWIYGEDDSEATFSALLNKLGDSTSDVVGGLKTSGRVLRSFSVAKTSIYTMTSQTWTNIPGLSLTITPLSSTSKFLLTSNVVLTSFTGGRGAHIKFAGGNAGNFIGDAASARVRSGASSAYVADKYTTSFGMTYLDSPATSGSITYTIQMRVGETGTAAMNLSAVDGDTADYGRPASSFTILEISA